MTGTPARISIAPLVVSAPFGNYVRPRGATATLGTFTLKRRHGRVWRVLRTVRYDPFGRSWVNRIGLRNPGVDWLSGKAADGQVSVSDAIVSIHGFDELEWGALIEKVAALSPLAIELNVSCPNVGERTWPGALFRDAVASGAAVIVKVPPVRYEAMVERALEDGVRVLHCCNTLPVPAGGMSGKPLKPVSLECIARVRRMSAASDDQPLIIGGGGITTRDDIDDYARAGADRFAVGTVCFNPLLLATTGPLRPLIERAREASEGGVAHRSGHG